VSNRNTLRCVPYLPDERMNMKTVLSVLFIIISMNVNCQIKAKGIIIDTISKQTLPYSTLIIDGTNIGTIADSNGCYELVIPDTISNNRFVLISSLSYEDKDVRISNLLNHTSIELTPKTYEIPEVLLIGKKLNKKISEFGICKHSVKTSSFASNKNIAIQIVLFIPNNDSLIGTISEVSFNIAKDRGIPNTPFRVRIFNKEDDKENPGSDLLTKSIIVSSSKNGGWTTVNIDSLSIPFPSNGLFVGMEWVNLNENYSYREQYKNDTTHKFGQCLCISNFIEEHRTWIRDMFHKKWRLANYWYSDRERTKPNNAMINIKVKTYK